MRVAGTARLLHPADYARHQQHAPCNTEHGERDVTDRFPAHYDAVDQT